MISENAPSPITSRQMAKGLGTTVLARLGAVVEIVAQPLYVLMFGLTGFGLYAVLWAAINFLSNIFDLGLSSALQRVIPQSADGNEAVLALRTALILGVGPCLAVAIAIFAAAPQIAPILNVAAEDQANLIPSIRLFIWAMPLWAFLEIATSALRAKLVFGAEIRLRIMWEQLLRLGFAVIFYALGFGLMGLMMAHLLSLVITAILSLRMVARHYDMRALLLAKWDQKIARNTLFSGLSILPGNILGRIFGDAPTLILNIYLPGAAGAAAAGLFTIARKLSSVVQLVRISFSYVMAPLASSAARHNRGQVLEIYAYAARFIFTIAAPMALVLAVGSEPLLTLFGDQAVTAQPAFIMLLFARALEAILGISSPVLQVISAFRHQLTSSFGGLAGALLVGFFAIDAFDPLTAITLAMSSGMAIAAAIPMLQLALIEKLHPFDHLFPQVLWRTLAISGFACVGAFFLDQLPDLVSVPLIAILAVAAIWASMRFALPGKDRQSLGKLGRKLRLMPKSDALEQPIV